MAILITPTTKIIVQGITGDFGGRHAKLSLDYGTQVAAGVTPGKGGQFFEHAGHKVPIFNSVADAAKATGATVSVIFVPPPFAGDAILECVDAGLDLAVAITEGIPVRDMVRVKRAMQGSKTRLLGPNCPGVVTPGTGKDHAQGRINTARSHQAPFQRCPGPQRYKQGHGHGQSADQYVVGRYLVFAYRQDNRLERCDQFRQQAGEMQHHANPD
jgi:hypothetical protein